MADKFIVWFGDVGKEDVALVGGKGANLGEMTKGGFPVPPGFIVTAKAYFHFLDQANIRHKMESALSGLDVADSKALEKAAKEVQKLILRSPFPQNIAQEIIHAYFTMDTKPLVHALVAVRSSATAEDLPTASFAGQQSTFLNVRGEANVIEKVREAWASLFTARAIFYRSTQKIDHLKVGIAVPIQRMVASEASGVMFTLDPVTNNKGKIVIEAIYGLGELIVQGAVTPDHYEVDKQSRSIVSKTVHRQEKKMVRSGEKTMTVTVSKALADKQKISDRTIGVIATLGMKLEQHYYFPQDAEWALDGGRVYIVQTRPVTTTGKLSAISYQQPAELKAEGRKLQAILKGDPASPGMATGPVKILQSVHEMHKVLAGDVLVTEMTNPDFVPAMRKAVGIVTERGGRTSHAAIVSRELGIPAVVGAKNARRILKEGMVVSVNGSTGEVYKGAVGKMTNDKFQMTNEKHQKIKTATKVYVNMADPGRANDVSKLDVDGVGLLRAEFMMAGIGIHPKKFIEEKREKEFILKLAQGVETIASTFYPRPVVYRASDFRTNEYRNLKGGDRYEPHEENPMLGFRGAARYIADPGLFQLELEMLLYVRNKKGFKNVYLMIPFVRSARELLEVKKMVAASGLLRSPTFKLWMMVEIPTNVILIEDYLDVGVDGISIGSNDLTMLILGSDRDNSEVAHDFNEQDPAVLWAFERVIRACAKHGVTTSICGQAPSDYPALVENLVGWGITSMSVNPDVIEQVRQTVSDAEKTIVRHK